MVVDPVGSRRPVDDLASPLLLRIGAPIVGGGIPVPRAHSAVVTGPRSSVTQATVAPRSVSRCTSASWRSGPTCRSRCTLFFTVFASGTTYDGCASGECPVLFKSTDSGAHWTPLGEGTFDEQSLRGKAPAGVLRVAEEAAVPAVVLAGQRTADVGSAKSRNPALAKGARHVRRKLEFRREVRHAR